MTLNSHCLLLTFVYPITIRVNNFHLIVSHSDVKKLVSPFKLRPPSNICHIKEIEERDNSFVASEAYAVSLMFSAYAVSLN